MKRLIKISDEKSGAFSLGIVSIVLAMCVFYFLENPPLTVFAFVLLCFGSYIMIDLGLNTKDILPKLISIYLMIIVFNWVLKFQLQQVFEEQLPFEKYVLFQILLLIQILCIGLILINAFLLFYVEKSKVKKGKTTISFDFIHSSIWQVVVLFFMILYLLYSRPTYNRIAQGLHSPKELADRYYQESSIEKRIGAYCRDGSESLSTGAGTCSHHGGVDSWKTEITYKKSYKQCYDKAKEVSWLK